MHFLFERRNIKDDKDTFLCLFDSYSRHFDKNDYIVNIGGTEYHLVGGVPRDFFNEKNVPWLKKG